MPTAIKEYLAAVHSFAPHELGGRDQPLVMRGACGDWPLVQAARRSNTAFATQLAALNNGTPVDTLLMAPEEQGIIGYNAQMDGFNYRHFRVSVTEALQRLATYSRHEGDMPGIALQSAPIRDCLPGFLHDHAVPFLDPHIPPRLWIGNRVTHLCISMPSTISRWSFADVGASPCSHRNRWAISISAHWISRPPAAPSA